MGSARFDHVEIPFLCDVSGPDRQGADEAVECRAPAACGQAASEHTTSCY